ncbi:MAG: hypothetical protein RR150_12170, partial [Clostridia bacterium]
SQAQAGRRAKQCTAARLLHLKFQMRLIAPPESPYHLILRACACFCTGARFYPQYPQAFAWVAGGAWGEKSARLFCVPPLEPIEIGRPAVRTGGQMIRRFAVFSAIFP